MDSSGESGDVTILLDLEILRRVSTGNCSLCDMFFGCFVLITITIVCYLINICYLIETLVGSYK